MYESQRGSDGRKTKVQEWEIKDVSGGPVYFKFVDNCFRKHFIRKSRKTDPKDSDTKALEKGLKRATRMGYGKNVATEEVRNSLEARYGQKGTPANTVVDLNRLDIQLVFTELAKALKAHTFSSNKYETFTLEFSKPCVRKTLAQYDDSSNTIPVNFVGDVGTKITIEVLKSNVGHSYQIKHMTS